MATTTRIYREKLQKKATWSRRVSYLRRPPTSSGPSPHSYVRSLYRCGPSRPFVGRRSGELAPSSGSHGVCMTRASGSHTSHNDWTKTNMSHVVHPRKLGTLASRSILLLDEEPLFFLLRAESSVHIIVQALKNYERRNATKTALWVHHLCT